MSRGTLRYTLSKKQGHAHYGDHPSDTPSLINHCHGVGNLGGKVDRKAGNHWLLCSILQIEDTDSSRWEIEISAKYD